MFFIGLLLIDLITSPFFIPASAAGPSLARGEHYMSEQCALEVAKAAQETLKRRDEAADGESSAEPEPELQPDSEPEAEQSY